MALFQRGVRWNFSRTVLHESILSQRYLELVQQCHVDLFHQSVTWRRFTTATDGNISWQCYMGHFSSVTWNYSWSVTRGYSNTALHGVTVAQWFQNQYNNDVFNTVLHGILQHSVTWYTPTQCYMEYSSTVLELFQHNFT